MMGARAVCTRRRSLFAVEAVSVVVLEVPLAARVVEEVSQHLARTQAAWADVQC